MTPYLVQRMMFRNPLGTRMRGDESFDHVLRMDYMGSAEFEYGELPKSLKRICQRADDIAIHVVSPFLKDCEGYRCLVVCLPEKVSEYSEFVHKMARGELRLKEGTYMDRVLTGKDSLGKPVDMFSQFTTTAWWDVENDVMFTFGDGRAQRIIHAIRQTRDNKKSQGREGWY